MAPTHKLETPRRRILAGVAIILLPALSPLVACLGDSQPSGARPNIVLVVVDALRRDHLGSFGYERPTSPRLDALVEEGVLFEDMTSVASQTVPATAGLFTGLYPSQSGVQYFGNLHSFDGKHHWQEAGPQLAESHMLLAEWLRELGYRTGAAVSNPWLQSQFGFAQGFDEYFFDHCVNLDAPKQDVCDGNDLVDRATEWLTASDALRAEDTFFLYLHFMDVHGPYSKPGITTEKFVRRPEPAATSNRSTRRREKQDVDYLTALYDEGIQHVDGVIGRFWDHLVESGVAEKTLLVVTSDHGDEFQEHGGLEHGTTLYQELVGSFLLLRYPERLPPARIPTPISMVDLMPTLAEILEAPLSYEGLGRSALSLAMSPAAPSRPSRYLFSELGERKAIRQGEWKLILEVESGGLELFDLANDPGERVNLAASEPEKADELRERLLAFLAGAATERPTESTQVPIDEDTLERLRALGYMQ